MVPKDPLQDELLKLGAFGLVQLREEKVAEELAEACVIALVTVGPILLLYVAHEVEEV